jgi:molybdopterin-binding protein
MGSTKPDRSSSLRLGQAAEILGVSTDTLRRWEADGRIATERSAGGQRLVALAEVRRLLAARRGSSGPSGRPTVRGSARNRFPGIVTRIDRDGIVAVVEILAGPHRVVSLMTAEAVEELGLQVGDEAVGVVKATTVIVEIPAPREGRS